MANCTWQEYDWDEFVPLVKAEAYTAPDEAICVYAREIAIEFSRRTEVLIEEIWLDAQENVATYAIEVPDQYKIHKIQQICVGQRDYDSRYRKPHPECPPCDCTYFFEKPCQISFYPPPRCDEAGGIFIRASLTPAHDSCTAHPLLVEEHKLAIVDGVLARIMMLEAAKFDSPGQAGVHAAAYRRAITEAKQSVQRAWSSGPRIARPGREFLR